MNLKRKILLIVFIFLFFIGSYYQLTYNVEYKLVPIESNTTSLSSKIKSSTLRTSFKSYLPDLKVLSSNLSSSPPISPTPSSSERLSPEPSTSPSPYPLKLSNSNLTAPSISRLDHENHILELKKQEPLVTDFWTNRNITKPAVCNDNSKRQTILKELLIFWDKIAKEQNIEYFLMYGTLLGTYRHEGMIPYDTDMDVMVMASETLKLERCCNKTYGINSILVQPAWRVHPLQRRKFTRKWFLYTDARVQRTKDIFLDIWQLLYDPTNVTQAKVMSKHHDWKEVSMSLEWFYPLQKCNFEGLVVNCPNSVHPILSTLYGKFLPGSCKLASQSKPKPKQKITMKTSTMK